MKKTVIVAAFLLLCTRGYTQQFPAFKQLRYDEGYSFLKKDSNSNWYKRTKYNPLSKSGDNWISFGGDIRYQYQWFKNENWGDAPDDKDGFILTRYLLHADWHAGKHFRTFVQLQSSFANGKEDTPSPVDENQLDLHQLFADWDMPLRSSQTLTLRIGRQELLYGSQRLVAVRDGPNNRQSFDAARLIYNSPGSRLDIFYSHFVRSQQKIFDDAFNKNTAFWGLYWTKNKMPLLGNVDLYYFGLWKQRAGFDDGAGTERRHSFGGRCWGKTATLRYDIEGLYQLGTFAGKDIRAWTFSVNGGYTIRSLKSHPEIGLKTELISGDATYGDHTLQTFNPLFPRGGYFGLVSLVGPANLFDIHPSFTMDLSKKWVLNADCDIFWRYSSNDGIYGPNAVLLYSGKGTKEKSIGRQYAADIVYTPNPFLYFRAECTWFRAGAFLKAVSPGKDILFTALTMQLKF